MSALNLWWWSAGCRGGLSENQDRARENAEAAALEGRCPARLELVVFGIDPYLEPVYVHTHIAFDGRPGNGWVTWAPVAEAMMAGVGKARPGTVHAGSAGGPCSGPGPSTGSARRAPTDRTRWI